MYGYSLLSKDSIEEDQQTIKKLVFQRQRQFETHLSQYLNYLVEPRNTEIGIVQRAANPTLLNDAELHLAVREFAGKVAGDRSYKEAAQFFLRDSRQTPSYGSFKVDLYEYLISSVEPEYGGRQFNDRLYKQIKNTLRENDSVKFNNHIVSWDLPPVVQLLSSGKFPTSQPLRFLRLGVQPRRQQDNGFTAETCTAFGQS